MGRAIDYCASCGDRVPAADLERGKAVEVAEQVWCGKCRSKAPAPAAAPANGAARKKTGSTGAFPAIKVGTGTQRLATPGGTSTGRLGVGHGSGRLPDIEDPRPAGGGKMPLIIGGVTLVLLIGAGALFFVTKSQDDARRAAEAKKTADAKASFESFVAFGREHPDDPEGQIALFEDASRKTKGSEWAGKLKAELEDAQRRKAVLDLFRARQKRLEELRTEMATATEFPPVAEKAKKFEEEMRKSDGDASIADQAGALAKQCAEKHVNKLMDAAQKFEAANSGDHDGAIALWSEALMAAEAFPQLVTRVKDRIASLRLRKEETARKAFDALKISVGNKVNRKDYDGAIAEVEAFKKAHRGTTAVDEAQKLGWDVELQRKKENEKQNPPRTGGTDTPKDWATLFDSKSTKKWRSNGTKGSWEIVSGVLVGKNSLKPEEAKGDGQGGYSIYYSDKGYSQYELEVDFTLDKGEAMIVVGLDGVDKDSPPGVSLWTSPKEGAGVMVKAGEAYTLTITVTADQITFKGKGVPEQSWNFKGKGDGKDHGAGIFGWALSPESEMRIRSMKIRGIPR